MKNKHGIKNWTFREKLMVQDKMNTVITSRPREAWWTNTQVSIDTINTCSSITARPR